MKKFIFILSFVFTMFLANTTFASTEICSTKSHNVEFNNNLSEGGDTIIITKDTVIVITEDGTVIIAPR